MIGLIRTSASPAPKEKIIVPITKHKYSFPGKNCGVTANTVIPINVITGISLTVNGMLNLCEKKENTRSIANCVTKFISTNAPKSEYEILYNSRKVRNNSGDIFATIAIETFDI